MPERSAPTGEPEDSRPATYEHTPRVRARVRAVGGGLIRRPPAHDESKLVSPEVEIFDEFTPKLRDSTYGSEEYEGFREAMGEALKHHYAANSHHPEHYAEGIHGMDLLDLIEMLCDWKAATLRHADGDLDRSIAINRERFGYGDEIEGLLRLTAQRLGMLEAPNAA